jgi:HlyD family secretion protein
MSLTSNTSQATPPGTTNGGAAPPERSIFRKAALERLSSPEQLDYLMSITSPVGWLALSAVAGVLFLIVLWGFLGRIPDMITGSGILIRGGAVYDVSAGTDGFITQVLVKTGDQVKAGQVVAKMSQSQLELKIKSSQAQLKVLQEQDADMTGREDKNDAAALADYKKQDQALLDAIASYKVQIEADQKEYDNKQSLLQKGLITQSEVNKARDALYAVKGQVADTQVKESQIATDEIKLARETQTSKNARLKEINSTKLQLQEYIEERNAGVQVLCNYSGRVIEKLVERGSPVAAKDRVITVEAEDVPMLAVIYVPAGEGKKVLPNQEIRVSPSTVKAEEYGFILGKVTNVSYFPSTPDGMKVVLRNEELVKDLSTKGAPIEITGDLYQDSSTKSGYRWSSSQGPSTGIFSGTLAQASIVVDQKPPIDFVIPKIKEILGLK